MTRAHTKDKKQTKIPPLRTHNKILISNKDKAEAFADALQKQFSTNKIGSLDTDRKVDRFIEDSAHINLEENENPHPSTEQKIIKKSEKRKHPDMTK